MNENQGWRNFWEGKFSSTATDSDADRLNSRRDDQLDELARAELLEFIDPKAGEVVFDAGCGTGGNVLMIHSTVRRIVAVDFADSAIQRAKAKAQAAGVTNAELLVGDISDSRLPESSFDRVLCLSVFHYLPDDQVRACLRSFASLLKPGGVLVLHVKNLASPYLASLRVLKGIRRLLGAKSSLTEHFRTFDWYRRELCRAGLELQHYNSFNLLLLEGLPGTLVRWLQKLELRRRNEFPFRSPLLRRHGADLKIRATLRAG